ncbi:HAD-IA family hydrolase [Pseudomonas sp. LS-2]|jgi:sugar-phosphatase|uniref:HAD-IA family hydrolase n=1 Tax=Pseudomonas sp. LS-2 TaxID=2315859 RepID=UPI000E721AE6|nr:HAD-IA family hydrolase [Pseudomonas sp. LS-2]RJX77463.1 HAD family hydrolase [Pseudomonas sp. LS-2]
MLEQHRFSAFLFDMDGTLTNSVAAAERVWSQWAEGKGLNVADFLPTIHGVRCIDTLRRLNLPGVDPEREADLLAQAEIDDVEGVVSIEGAARFLAALPAERWAVVTSAPRLLAERRILAAGLPLPQIMVSAEDVEHGKPAPDCFLLAARKLGVKPDECLVFEDAPAGIAAAEAAGAKVMVITAAHSHVIETAHPTLATYDSYGVVIDEQGFLQLRVN